MSEEAGQNAAATDGDSMAALAGQIQDPAPAVNADSGQQPASSASDMEEFIKQQSQRFDEIAGKAEESMKTVNELAESEQRRVLNEAVDNAVEKINDGVDGDKALADTFLNSQYQRDPNFKKVFDNRNENPEAYEKALGLLKTEWASMNQKSIDPQVAENQRALRESQQSGSTYQTVERDQEMANMSDGDFLREARTMARNG